MELSKHIDSRFVSGNKGIRKTCLLIPLSFIFWFQVFSGSSISYKTTNSSGFFIENKGQIIDQNNNPNTAVFYLLNTPGMNVQLRREGFSYDLYRISNNEQRTSDCGSLSGFQFHRIDIDFLGSNPACELVTYGQSSDYTNYFTTGIPAEGVTYVKSYRTIIYKNIYPGIDLEFSTNEEHDIKYSFVIAPGGSISSIRMKFRGADVLLNSDSSLSLSTSLGNIMEEIPVSYLQSSGIRNKVKVSFRQIDNAIYGFKCDQEIDASTTLIIDPIPYRVWGTYYGGSDADFPGVCSVDNFGNVFLCSYTYSVTNIATAGAHQVTFMGLSDAFLIKFDPDGVRQWGTYYGGTGIEDESTCACDLDGNVLIGGRTTSSTNISTPGCFQPIFNGDDGYLAKFDGNGIRLWGTYYGGTNMDVVNRICATESGDIFITGTTISPDFIASPGAYQQVFGGGCDAFLARFTSAGQRLWGTYYGGAGNDFGTSISTDPSGNIFFTGWTTSNASIASPGAFQTNLQGGMDGYIASFDQSGNRQWATYFGGNHADVINSVACDQTGRIVFGGETLSTTGLATPGAFQTSLNGSRDGFLARFTTGGQQIWTTYYGGENEEIVLSCAIGKQASIYLMGWTQSLTGLATPGAFQPDYLGSTDAMIAKFDSSGQRQWGSYFGGPGIDNFKNITSDTTTVVTSIYLSGNTFSTENIATIGSHQLVISGLADSFLEKFRDCVSPDSAGVITGDQIVCSPAAGVVYSVSPILNAAGYIWQVPPGVTITGGQNTNAITVDVGVGAYSDSISVYGTNNCGIGDSSYLFVQVFEHPVPTITGPDTSCVGQTELYYSESGNSNYHWIVSPGGTQVAGGLGTDTSITIQWNTIGSQWLSVTYMDTNGCSAIAPTQKNVYIGTGDTVHISISPSANNICAGTQVTYTAVPTNGGINPTFQWKVNGTNAGTNNPIFTYIPLNGDQVWCILNSSITSCVTNNPAISDTIIMIVNPNLPVSDSVWASANPVCAGTSVTFTVIPTNGGTNPVFQWKLNGVNTGANSPTFTITPSNGDFVTCNLTSSETCTTGNPATSNQVTMVVDPILSVNVSISASANPFCPGNPVTFTVVPTNGGTTPQYQWQVNGVNTGSNNPIFTYIPASLDLVSCILISSETCPTGNPDTSNIITMIPNLSFPAGVSIIANPNPFCPGSSVTFTAIPVNGGTTPTYQWKVNGINTGTNSPNFSYNPQPGDSISCVMTSNLACVSNNPVWSNRIIMVSSPVPVVTFMACFDTVTTVNAKPIKLKGGIPLGGTYSGPGVSGGYFYPNLAGSGNHQITYTYTNSGNCTDAGSLMLDVIVLAPFACGNNLIDIRDGKVYPTIQIGSQCWFAADLNFGTEIPPTLHQRDNCIIEKYFNPASSIQHPASVYQWDEMMRYDNTPALQGICPPAWHIPTEAEWATLFSNWTNNAFAASPLKYSGYSGFNAFLSGARHETVQWDYQGFAVFFWSSTAYGPYKAWAHGMNDPDPSVSYYPSLRSNAFSVRCLRD